MDAISASKRNINLLVILIGSFVALLNQTLLATALPKIMQSLNIGLETAQWLTTSYMLINGIMIPITAYMIGSVPNKKLYIGSMILFTVGTFIAAISGNFFVLMFGRALQAIGSGIMMSLGQVVVLSIFPMEKRGMAMGLYGLVIGMAPAIGPTLAGVIVEHFPWQSLFYIVLPILIINTILGVKVLSNITELTNPKLDIPSVILSTIGFGGLLYGVSSFDANNAFNREFIISLIIGLIALIAFVRRQHQLDEPMLDFSVLKNRVFCNASILSVVVTVSMIGAETLIPILMQNLLGFTALDTGIIMLPGAMLLGIMMPVSGRLFDRFGIKGLSIIGFLLIALTSFLFMQLNSSIGLIYIAIVYMVRMFGVSLVMMPLVTAGMNELPKNLFAHGTAVINTFRQVGGAIGTAILVAIMTNQIKSSISINSIMSGFAAAFIFATIISIIGVILAFMFSSQYKVQISE